ncbi:MAG: DUF885 domain-containing protein [Pseudomonadota bacterium]
MNTKCVGLLLAITAPLTLAGCDTLAPPVATIDCATTQTECLYAWFETKFEEELAFSPIRQTALGRKTDYGKIDDFSVEGLKALANWWQQSLAEMEANFDYEELSSEAQLSYDMFAYRSDLAAQSVEFADQEYILHQMGGTHTTLPSFMLTQHKVEDESDMADFISRLGGIGGAMDQLLQRAKDNAEAGTRPPRFAYDAVIAESGNVIRGFPFDQEAAPSILWSASEGHLTGLVDAGSISEERAEELRAEASAALTEKLAPAYTRVIAWFTEDRPNSDEAAKGANTLPNGEDFYSYRLNLMTTTDMTAEDVHQKGLEEVARIRAEMEAIMDTVNFDGTLREFFAFTREDDQFYYQDNDAGAQEYIAQAETHLDFIKDKLPKYFGTLPQAPLVVKRVEPFREQDGAAQHYRAGTPDGSRPGTYYAHLSDMRAMPIPVLEAIAYHEGNPGHHMQVSIAQELTDLPKFQAQGGFISAFGEGWALYSEALAKEMGGYQDPYSDFGRLSSEIWRAIRLVVDTGIHAKGWSEQEAIDYFLENSPSPETTVRSEVRRYFVLPGQATSYKIGMIRIQELRAEAEAELGDAFDIRGFHDTVLSGGAVPLGILEKRVDQWVESVKAS